MLQKDTNRRLSVDRVLSHPWMTTQTKSEGRSSSSRRIPRSVSENHPQQSRQRRRRRQPQEVAPSFPATTVGRDSTADNPAALAAAAREAIEAAQQAAATAERAAADAQAAKISAVQALDAAAKAGAPPPTKLPDAMWPLGSSGNSNQQLSLAPVAYVAEQRCASAEARLMEATTRAASTESKGRAGKAPADKMSPSWGAQKFTKFFARQLTLAEDENAESGGGGGYGPNFSASAASATPRRNRFRRSISSGDHRRPPSSSTNAVFGEGQGVEEQRLSASNCDGERCYADEIVLGANTSGPWGDSGRRGGNVGPSSGHVRWREWLAERAEGSKSSGQASGGWLADNDSSIREEVRRSRGGIGRSSTMPETNGRLPPADASQVHPAFASTSTNLLPSASKNVAEIANSSCPVDTTPTDEELREPARKVGRALGSANPQAEVETLEMVGTAGSHPAAAAPSEAGADTATVTGTGTMLGCCSVVTPPIKREIPPSLSEATMTMCTMSPSFYLPGGGDGTRRADGAGDEDEGPSSSDGHLPPSPSPPSSPANPPVAVELPARMAAIGDEGDDSTSSFLPPVISSRQIGAASGAPPTSPAVDDEQQYRKQSVVEGCASDAEIKCSANFGAGGVGAVEAEQEMRREDDKAAASISSPHDTWYSDKSASLGVALRRSSSTETPATYVINDEENNGAQAADVKKEVEAEELTQEVEKEVSQEESKKRPSSEILFGFPSSSPYAAASQLRGQLTAITSPRLSYYMSNENSQARGRRPTSPAGLMAALQTGSGGSDVSFDDFDDRSEECLTPNGLQPPIPQTPARPLGVRDSGLLGKNGYPLTPDPHWLTDLISTSRPLRELGAEENIWEQVEEASPPPMSTGAEAAEEEDEEVESAEQQGTIGTVVGVESSLDLSLPGSSAERKAPAAMVTYDGTTGQLYYEQGKTVRGGENMRTKRRDGGSNVDDDTERRPQTGGIFGMAPPDPELVPEVAEMRSKSSRIAPFHRRTSSATGPGGASTEKGEEPLATMSELGKLRDVKKSAVSDRTKKKRRGGGGLLFGGKGSAARSSHDEKRASNHRPSSEVETRKSGKTRARSGTFASTNTSWMQARAPPSPKPGGEDKKESSGWGRKGKGDGDESGKQKSLKRGNSFRRTISMVLLGGLRSKKTATST